MVWTILGDPGLSFRVDENGLSISGKGRQSCGPSATFDWTKIDKLPAEWTIYRASEASETAMSISIEASTLKHYLDAAAVKVATTPISIITFHEEIDYANPSCVFFSTFLPDAYFANVWKLAKIITSHSEMSYQIRFGFQGFLPQRVRQHPNFIEHEDRLLIYEDWLAGRPYISKEDFAFEVRTGSA
jgi:hypothetical protein